MGAGLAHAESGASRCLGGKLRSDELTPLELSFFFGNERKVWTAYELTREEFEGKLSRKTMEEIHADWIERSSSYY